MTVHEALEFFEMIKGYITITDYLRSHSVAEETYREEIKPILMSFRSFLSSIRFDYASFEWLRGNIKLLEEEIVQKNSKQS